MNYYGRIEETDTLIGNMGVGVDYYKGETGAQGIPGKDGKDGKTPIKGVDYYTDEEIASIKEEIAKEVTVGAKGEDGKSAYQIALDEGFEGSETDWLASLKGKDGKDGINGTDGKPGKDGTNGVDGKTPVKGVDYFTQAEIQQVENNAAAKVDLSDYAKSADLSTVATSGSYEDLTNKPTIPAAYELPVASATTLGGVKVGSGLDITNGVLSATGGGVADAVDWSKVQNKPNFADVATSGNYNDLSNKPTIPSVEGLASEAYVNEKVAAIVIPEVPTKVSELENDKGYLTEHQSLEGYAKTADLAQVAKTGSYNDLADKPTIPSTTGLASTKYVDDKVAGIVVPEVPTKVSAFENDKGYLTEHQNLKNYIQFMDIGRDNYNHADSIAGRFIAATYDVENNEITTTYAKKTEIPTPYTLPTASTSTLGGVKVDGSTITIADGVISAKSGSGGAEPDAYIKDASVSGNTLTLTKKDDTNVVFTPSGGSVGGVSGYAFTSSQTFTDDDKLHLKEIYLNKNIYMTIDKLSVFRIVKLGTKYGFSVLNTNGASSNQVLIYAVDIDGNENVTSSTFSLYTSYYLIGNNSAVSGEIITSDNYSNYITIPEMPSFDWNYTNDYYNSDFYNAKELIIVVGNGDEDTTQCAQYYYNFSKNKAGEDTTLGTSFTNCRYPLYAYNNSNISWEYNGSALNIYNISVGCYFLYRT